jgi:hypothetical protein
MINTPEHTAGKEPLNLERIVTILHEKLPTITSELIGTSENIDDPRQQDFMADPDNPAYHALMWHQYGVLTHSEKFRSFIANKAPDYIKQWGIAEQATAILSEKIDGTTKSDLLQIASLVHDLGKFTSRIFQVQPDGTELARFIDHEAHSGEIIRHNFKRHLDEFGLTDAQIEYIAQCAEHHFDLGKVRRVADANGGYTLEFARSETFANVAQDIIAAIPELSLEIGLMFMADSFSKTQFSAKADTDEGIAKQKTTLQAEIQAAGAEPLLINQALQQPVNIEIGRQFLQQWATFKHV